MMNGARHKRWAMMAAGMGAATLLLTGCIKVDATMTIDPEATATGTIALALQKQAASLMGMTSFEQFSSEIGTEDLAAGSDLNAFGDCVPSQTETDFVYTCSFTDQAFTDATGPWTIARDGSSVVLHVVNKGDATANAEGADLLNGASLGTVTVTATLPGAITAVTGEGATKTSDSTVAITGSLTAPLDVTVTSEAGDTGFSVSSLLTILIALGVVVLLVAAVFVLVRRRRAALAPPSGSAASQAPITDGTDSSTPSDET